ncbi:MAG: WYL domain-containing protein [Clostridia bacterium]|nr:WYL domain-containing protein [Clostridia bacterium]
MDYIGGRHDRILAVYNNLIEGAGLNVKSAAEHFGVSTKTIKRDIDDIRNFLSEKSVSDGSRREVIYDRANDNYRLVGCEKLSAKEIFALCKVMLESRAFCKKEFMPIMEKMIDRCAYDAEVAHIKDMVANEKFHYCEPRHKKELIDMLWTLSAAIKERKRLKIVYDRLTEPKHKERIVEPVGIMFSDYYFYLAAFIPEKETKNPTIYRIDRLSKFEIQPERFSVPYSNRFEEGEFRKRVQFMYGGDLLKLEFKYYGESVEAILDRLPTAEVISQENGVFLIRAEVFGRGIKPWILAQTDKIEVTKPIEFRNEIKGMISDMLKFYK